VKVKVVSIDLEREKVGLSMKDCDNSDILDKKREQARESYKRQEKRDEVHTKSEIEDDCSAISGNISFS
jgi:predicted RNA-binding protein with RPS1 domain